MQSAKDPMPESNDLTKDPVPEAKIPLKILPNIDTPYIHDVQNLTKEQTTFHGWLDNQKKRNTHRHSCRCQ